MEAVLSTLNAVIWGIPVLSLILITGIVLTVRSRFAQLRFLPAAIKQFLRGIRKSEDDSGSSYRALCTALAATVGTGNIAGVAGAIAIGGPGVIFWMWICAILGMATKFAEVVLAMHYRTRGSDGSYIGGPMYTIQRGLPKRMHFLAYVYSYFGVIAALGIGNAAQINAVTDGLKSIAASVRVDFGYTETVILGIAAAALIPFVFRKGASGIGKMAEKLVPFASIIYLILAFTVLFIKIDRIIPALRMILTGAFSPKAVTGGVLGSVFLTLRIGISRGVFTNEAGMGTACIAHASSDVKKPVQQGMMGIMEVFLDTIVICTLTALVILCSGVTIPYGTDPGIVLTMDAFSAVLGNWCCVLLTILTCIFAFATILGWGLYGARCSQFIFGEHAWNKFVFAQSIAVVFGAVLNTSVVWLISEIVNGLMAIPNLIAILLLMENYLSCVNKHSNKGKAYSRN